MLYYLYGHATFIYYQKRPTPFCRKTWCNDCDVGKLLNEVFY